MTTQQQVLQAEGLSKIFGGRRRWFDRSPGHGFAAVSDVSFDVARGETLGIVGESGSGKSTAARMLLRLVEPSGGRVLLEGADLMGLDAEALRARRRGIQMVFQDPFSSLNPRLRVGAQIGEPLHIHGLATGAAVGERVAELMKLVGLDPVRMHAYPHEFSGGQRQRIAIARAIASEPKVIVADEAVSALDVSVRAQILNLFDDLKRTSELALIFISHDLGVIRHLVDRVAVMYRGRIVELGPTVALFASSRHPYTRALLSAIPAPRAGPRRARVHKSPSLVEAVGGCSYATQCLLAVERCRRETPELSLQSSGQLSACFRAADLPPLDPDPAGVESAATERLRRLQARFAKADAGAARST